MKEAVKRVLVPIDRSEYKEKIVGHPISLGKAWKADMIVYFIVIANISWQKV